MSNFKELARHSHPSIYEKLFNFRDVAFREYMSIHSQGRTPIDTMYNLSERMASSKVSVVMYAAGWAFTELSLRKDISLSHAWRVETINQVKNLWETAQSANDVEFKKAQDAQDSKKIQEHFNLELQILFSRMHLPTIQAVSERIVTGSIQQDLLETTHENLMQLNQWLIEHPDKNNPDLSGYIVGTLGESLASTLIHRSKSSDLFATPSSFRQQNLPTASLRADIIGHYFSEEEYRKIPVQIKSKKNENEFTYEDVVLIYINPFLSFKETKGAMPVIRFLLEEYAGNNNLGKAQEVDEMTAWLIKMISKHKYNSIRPRRK